MVKLHLKDGRTLSFDLEDRDDELRDWLERPGSQEHITAITLVEKFDRGVQYSVTRPEGFEGDPWFEIEKIEPNGKTKGGERLVLFVGDVRLALTSHKSQPAARVSITKIGRRVGGKERKKSHVLPRA